MQRNGGKGIRVGSPGTEIYRKYRKNIMFWFKEFGKSYATYILGLFLVESYLGMCYITYSARLELLLLPLGFIL